MTRFPALLLSLMALLTGLPGPSLALSCLRPDPVRTFNELSAVPEPYVLVVGSITFDTSRLPRTDTSGTPPSETILPARLSGQALGHAGFSVPYEREIELTVLCFAHWCGGLAAPQRILAFVERRPDVDRLTITPCGGHAFTDPSRAQLRQMRDCISGGPCVAPSP